MTLNEGMTKRGKEKKEVKLLFTELVVFNFYSFNIFNKIEN